MHRHHQTKILPYRPEQLFELVGGVDAYPQFVPWITSMRTWNARQIGPQATSIDAEAGVGFSFLRETFSTRVTRDARVLTIEVSLLNGPFKVLKNHWRFIPDPAGCKVEFDIDFAFKIGLLDAMLNANMDRAVRKLIACFEGRAEVVYGKVETAQIGAG